MMFAHLCGCSPALEQPTTSSMPKLQPLQAVLQGIDAKKEVIWHGAYSGKCPKPLQVWSPRDLSALVRPRPTNLASNLVKTGTKRMSTGETKGTYTGTKALKASQTYCKPFAKEVASLAKAWVTEAVTVSESADLSQ